ncbi:hypothetical protein PIB30_068080 [Stylosanthes scabra]|uniref:Uncharacterized protein n=1 Tax=Stylosanthes scabra TaxID=79078 RepID=A0ABU6QMS4_9FABA|nr:hypothetical protein [Stylosanthes scabra]
MRHNAMNAEPVQPPQHAEAELNAAAAIVDPPTDSFSQRTINLSSDDNLPQKTVNAEYITPQPVIVLALEKNVHKESVAVPRELVMDAAAAAMDDTGKDAADAAAIKVEEEALTTELTTQHITPQPVIVLALEKHGDKESVAVPRKPVTAPTKEDAIPTDKEVQRQMNLGVSIIAEMVASGDYFHFTQPSFDLGSEFGSQPTLSQGQPQQAEIHGE